MVHISLIDLLLPILNHDHLVSYANSSKIPWRHDPISTRHYLTLQVFFFESFDLRFLDSFAARKGANLTFSTNISVMKPRVAKYISKCAMCAQVKVEHQVLFENL
ncbi:hypothetical protein LXL04_003761 [Taraxacum kok-saghyz]